VSDLDDALASFRDAIARNDKLAAREVERAYSKAWAAIKPELGKVTALIETAQARGEVLGPSWLMRQERYVALQRTIATEMTRYSRIAMGPGMGAPAKGVDAAYDFLRDVGAERAPRTGGVDVPRVGQPDWWAQPPKRSLEALAGALRGPVGHLLDTLPGQIGDMARRELTDGLLLGRNPNRVASLITQQAAGLALTRARTIARTEMLRALREGTRQGYQDNAKSLDGWRWASILDTRTCGYCWGQHGTLHTVNEVLTSHPNCRCAMVPQTKSWGEILGDGPDDPRYKGIPDVGRDVGNMVPGVTRFEALSRAEQLRILGPARLRLFDQGVGIRSMWTTTDHPVWGPTPRQIPVRDLMLQNGITELPGTRFVRPTPAPIAPVAPSAMFPPEGFTTTAEAEAWLRARFPTLTEGRIESHDHRFTQTHSELDPVTNRYKSRTETRTVTEQIDMAILNDNLRELDRLATRYPYAVKRLNKVNMIDLRQGDLYAHANDTLIEWNNYHYTNRAPNPFSTLPDTMAPGARARTSLRRDIKSSFHPSVREEAIDASITTHEFGHALHYSLLRDYRAMDGSGRVYDPAKRLDPGALQYGETVAYAWASWVRTTRQTGGVVSTYARKSEFERVAEAFAAYQHQPREQWKPYVHKLAAILEAIDKVPG
jgi:SPP1 gp7 family putative phage head morphogenesis protein